MSLLLNKMGNLVTQKIKMAEILNAFFARVFTSKTRNPGHKDKEERLQ